MTGASQRREDQAAMPHALAVRAPDTPDAADTPRLPGASNRSSRLRTRPSAHIQTGKFHVSSEWITIAPVMAMTYLLMAIGSLSLPPLASLLMAAAAIAIPMANRKIVRFERETKAGEGLRLLTMALGVGLPMLLFGGSIADWVYSNSAIPWIDATGVLLITGTVGSVALAGRWISKVTATSALWVGMVVVSESVSAYCALAIGIGFGAIAVSRQTRLDRAEAARQRALERAQLRAEELLAEFEQTGQGWFWETDRRGALTYLSPTIGDILGRDVKKLLGRPFTKLFILGSGDQDGERTLLFHLSARSSFQDLAVRAAVTGEDERWWSISGRPIHDHLNNFIGFRGSGNDLTEKRRSQADASRLAHYDSLTSLANRFQMAQTLEKILTAQRIEQRACAVFLIDLDRFKQVNDTMGHPAGDALLMQVAQRLERTVNKDGRVGRLGGDEFKVVLPGKIDRNDLANLAQLIIENLSQPYSIEGHRVVIGASIGIALSPDDGVTSEALIRNADLALYAAKDGGRGRHHFYAADLHTDAEERRQLEQDLRDAITTGGLELHYQPVVHTTTEKITGFEALLRWTHPTLGPLSPAKFIPIAEDAGLIAPIGEWALRTACNALATWPEDVRVAVNVSPLQFANPALPAIVTNALAAAQVDPCRLELEITESVFLNDDADTDAMFTALKRVGVRLALDDFGTGYSSLGYLKKAPFDKIKIDQSFVRGATMRGSRNGAIMSAIVSLAEALGMETTAEGVETLDELDLVRMLGCSHIQGYIYEKPLTAAAATARLEAGLVAIARGHRAARPTRMTMLRKVVLEHGGATYNGTIRNISTTGALIEGLWNVPQGTQFAVQMSAGHVINATARWCKDDRMGVEFDVALESDGNGGVQVAPPRRSREPSDAVLQRKAG